MKYLDWLSGNTRLDPIPLFTAMESFSTVPPTPAEMERLRRSIANSVPSAGHLAR